MFLATKDVTTTKNGQVQGKVSIFQHVQNAYFHYL